MANQGQVHPLISPMLETDKLLIGRVDIKSDKAMFGATSRQIYLAFEKKNGCCRPVVTVTVSEELGAVWRRGPMVEYIETITCCRRLGYASEVWRKLEEIYGQPLFFTDTTDEGRELVRFLGYDDVNTESGE